MSTSDKVIELSEKLGNIISSLLSILLIVQMIGDLLGINVFELLKTALTKPWVIPVEWIYMYYPLWYALEWVLLILMLADQVFTMRYMQTHKSPPPPTYARYMSLAIFLISFWLALILRYMTFTIIAVFSSITFSYTMFVKRA